VSDELLVQVYAPHFTAGFTMRGNRVDTAAPILRRDLLHKTREEARAIIRRKGWRALVIQSQEKI